MTDNTKRGLEILMTALALGLAGNFLLRETPWGLNVSLWTVAIVLALLCTASRHRIALRPQGRWLLLSAVFAACLFSWRDSRMLKMADMGIVLTSLGLSLWYSRFGQVCRSRFLNYIRSLLLAGLNTLFSPALLLFTDIQWREIPRFTELRRLKAIVRGVLIAVPLLTVFGTLLASADALFAHYIAFALRIDLDTLASHVFLSSLFAWLAGGFLRGALLREAAAATNETRPPLFTLGIVEVGLTLGLLDLLFFAFVLVQLRYFFGGAHLVQSAVHMTYAEYARRGFFELTTVAALVLPVLLVSQHVLRREHPRDEMVYRVLAGVQVALLAVIMASAVQRMLLYQNAYGLTEQRLYTLAFMGWLGVVFLWFAATALRGKREPFAFGAMASGFAAVFLLHVLNPDAQIVRFNTEIARYTHRRDIVYDAHLSADAVPELMARMPGLDAKDQQQLAAILLDAYAPSRDRDWRSWSWSQQQARHTLRQNLRQLAPLQKEYER